MSLTKFKFFLFYQLCYTNKLYLCIFLYIGLVDYQLIIY